jgi:hypothetical protein
MFVAGAAATAFLAAPMAALNWTDATTGSLTTIADPGCTDVNGAPCGPGTANVSVPNANAAAGQGNASASAGDANANAGPNNASVSVPGANANAGPNNFNGCINGWCWNAGG